MAISEPAEEAGFCRPWTPAELQAVDQGWQAWQAERAQDRPPAPPMRNVGLALDLVGDGVREFSFRGETYRLRPTPYASGLQLSQVMQVLEQLKGIGDLTGHEELTALRDCYALIATLGGELLIPLPTVNPFLAEAGQEELQRLLLFLVATGDQTPVPLDVEEGTPRRWNAAHHLLHYESVFGPATTWQKFCAGLRCLTRLEAERAIQQHGAVRAAIAAAFGDDEARLAWLQAQRQDAR